MFAGSLSLARMNPGNFLIGWTAFELISNSSVSLVDHLDCKLGFSGLTGVIVTDGCLVSTRQLVLA